ncbi:MAG: hypothetical protein KDC54_21470 [Lewinella sp.]|nr:hypothetical protein [Lewinella sp.]
MKNVFLSALSLLLVLSLSAQTTPVGWASLNGGTTGGEGGETVTVTNRTELIAAVNGSTPRIVLVQDTIELNLYERVKIYSNKTVLGATQDAMIRFGGLEIVGENVILQNLVVGDFYDGDWGGTTHSTDGLTIYGVNVWVDHCWFYACADGLLDIRSGNGYVADYVTISNTRFSDHNKVSLIGASDDNTQDRDHLRITYYQCWFDGTYGNGVNQRMPRVRFGDVHVLNTYYEETDSYGIAARIESDVVVEGSYFRNCKNPHIIDDVGVGLEDPDLVAIDNVYEQCTGSTTTHGTAFVPGNFYAYTIPPTPDVPALVMNEAGPFNSILNFNPVAVNDTVDYSSGVGAVNVYAADNDLDGDGGDLRIAQIVNDPPGGVSIKQNRITYFPIFGSTGIDTIMYSLVDTQGGVDTGMVLIFYDGVNATEELEKTDALGVFPNPALETTTLQLPAGFGPSSRIRLFNSAGAELPLAGRLQAQGDGVYQLRTLGLPAGAYWISARDGERQLSHQLIITQ